MRWNKWFRRTAVMLGLAVTITAGCGTGDSGMVTVPAKEQTAEHNTADCAEKAAGAADKNAQNGRENAEIAGKDDGSGKDEGAWDETAVPEIPGLVFQRETERKYARGFRILYYQDTAGNGYTSLLIRNGVDVFLIPEGGKKPETLSAGTIVLEKPVDKIYLAATASMSLFDRLDALDRIAFSGTRADGWYVENAKTAMEDGDILFAGKYSAPDFEKLLADGCRLAVESTMILHVPEIREKLENIGIPVFLDRSSYEDHPLGRTEWIKVYGALLGKEPEAETFFDTQTDLMKNLDGTDLAGKTVGIFSINSLGEAAVRNSEDYLAEMIRLAGGTYAFDDLKNPNPENHMGSLHLSMEEFYAEAKDADYLIYNAAIEDAPASLRELTDRNPLLADFKAVKEGRVYCADGYFYQATDQIARFIKDVNTILSGGDESGMLFLEKLS